MEERGSTKKVQQLRAQSLSTEPHISIERAVLMTEAYKEHEGTVSTPVLRALAFKKLMEHKKLCINDGELIVGEKGEGPQSTPTFPELCCHTLEDLEVMSSRERIYFNVDDHTKQVQAETIIPFWEKRSIRHKIINAMTEEWRDCYYNGFFTEFMEQRSPGHTVADGKMYRNGFLDFKERIEAEIKKIDFLHDLEANKKHEQLKAMSICCDAIIAYGKRYADYARDLASKESDPKRKEELRLIASNCDVVPAHKPESFMQAVQMYWFAHIGVTSELNNWDAYSPGRLDQHIYPFYKKDTENGTLTREAAQEILECLWVKFNNQPAPPKVGITLKESGTYTDFANINTGGITEDGQNGVNDVSYLILDTMDEMKLLQPSSNVQISQKTPSAFLKRACEISRKGWGQPAFYNTEAIIQELMNAGKSIEDARQGGTSGCVETGAYGKEAYILTGYFNLPKILEVTLNNGYDPVSKKQLGLQLGHAEDFESYDALFEAYKKQIKHFIDIKVRGNNVIEQIYAEYMPSPFLSILTDDCIARAKDYNNGGARYNTNYIQGVGIGTITDSLSAIKYNVYDKKKFTMREMMAALEHNFEGYEKIHNLVQNKTPKYGNDDDYADDIMRSVFFAYRDEVTGRPNVKGGHYRVDMLPTTAHVYFGSVIKALPNGRKASKPVSEGISPEKGADINGPTAVVKSASKMDHLSTGGTLLNQKFTPSVVADDRGLENMSALVRSYFTMDGHHIQFNVVDRQLLLDAQKNPADYNDLIVRVAGYSDHFNNLDKALQDEIIYRTEQNFE